MKKYLARLLSLAMALSLTACGGAKTEDPAPGGDSGAPAENAEYAEWIASVADDDPVVLSMAGCNTDESLEGQSIHDLAEILEEMSGGNMTLDVYTGGILGSQSDMIQSVKGGSIDMMMVGPGAMEGSCPSICTISYLYAYQSEEHCLRVWNSELGQSVVQNLIDEANVRAFDIYYTGWRALFSKEKMTSPDDLVGKKLRIAEIPLFVNAYTALKASPVYIDMSETYSGLSSGICDVVEQQMDIYLNFSLYDVAPYVFMDYHAFSWESPMINEDRFQRLTPAQQALLTEACNRACAKARENYTQWWADLMKAYEENGCEIYEVTPEQRADIQEQLKESTLSYISGYGDQSTVDFINSLA